MGTKRGSQRKLSASSPTRGKREKEERKVVKSKIELTTQPQPQASSSQMVASLHKYRSGVRQLGGELAKQAVLLAGSNLLNAKLGLWEAIKVVEGKLKERRV